MFPNNRLITLPQGNTVKSGNVCSNSIAFDRAMWFEWITKEQHSAPKHIVYLIANNHITLVI